MLLGDEAITATEAGIAVTDESTVITEAVIAVNEEGIAATETRIAVTGDVMSRCPLAELGASGTSGCQSDGRTEVTAQLHTPVIQTNVNHNLTKISSMHQQHYSYRVFTVLCPLW